MAKFKLQAGVEMDILSPDDLDKALARFAASWRTEIARGAKFRLWSGRADVSGGVWTIGGVDNRADRTSILGPEPGFVWAVTRAALAGNGVVLGTDTWSVYVDEITPSRVVASGLTRSKEWDVPQLALNGTQKLAFSGVGTGATGTDVFVSGGAVELPEHLAWQLLG